MIIVLVILALALLAYLIFRFWFFTPKTNIYYLVKLFDAEYRSIYIVGEEDDSKSLEPLIRPFEKIEPFKFKFQKLVTIKEATEKGWSVTFELPGDPKVVVEREEIVPGWLAIELHAVGIEFVTKNGTDISLCIECAYRPLNGNGAVRMKKTVKNWSAFADTQIQNIIGAWGRNKKNDEEVLKITIDQIMNEVASDILTKAPGADPGETVRHYLNEIFNKKGFEIVTMTLYKVVNGKQSQDVKERREAIKKAQLDFKKAKFERKTEYEEGMAQVDLQKESLNNQAEYIERVNRSKNETILGAAEKLTNLTTLVIGDDFNNSAFTGAKIGSEKTKKEVHNESGNNDSKKAG